VSRNSGRFSLSEPLELHIIRDGHDTRDYRHITTRLPNLIDVSEIRIRIEENLRTAEFAPARTLRTKFATSSCGDFA
jgi:hypothetical protein